MDNVYIEIAKTEEIEYISNNIEEIFQSSWNKENLNNCVNMPNSITYVAKKDSTVLGYICIQHVLDEIEVLNICVDINYRKNGIGQQLIQYVINLSNKQKLSTIFLEVNVNNIQAIKLYEKVGFQIISTRKGYYFNKLTNNIEDAYIMNFKGEYIC